MRTDTVWMPHTGRIAIPARTRLNRALTLAGLSALAVGSLSAHALRGPSALAPASSLTALSAGLVPTQPPPAGPVPPQPPPAEATAPLGAPRSDLGGIASRSAPFGLRESFDRHDWFARWGTEAAPHNTEVITDRAGNGFLRVTFPRGQHQGTRFALDLGELDSARLQYRMKLNFAWDASPAASNVKLPGFARVVRAQDGSCVAACGGQPADGVRSYSARGDMGTTNVGGFYVYDLDHRGVALRWGVPGFELERWYLIDIAIQMNTPGRADGRLTARVDGLLVFDKRDLRFRQSPALGVGEALFDFHYGGSGTPPTHMSIAIDDVVIEAGSRLPGEYGRDGLR